MGFGYFFNQFQFTAQPNVSYPRDALGKNVLWGTPLFLQRTYDSCGLSTVYDMASGAQFLMEKENRKVLTIFQTDFRIFIRWKATKSFLTLRNMSSLLYFAEKAVAKLLKFSNGIQTEFYDQYGCFCCNN